MLSILINAYACSPGMGSEPGMAWNWCVNLAKYCELHIVTEGEFRDRIEAVLPTLPQGANMHFYYNPVSDKIRQMCWNQGDWRFYKYYKEWQKKTYLIAKEICGKRKIDVLHQLNMIGFREPGYLWKLSRETGIPFVWGPIGGLKQFPLKYADGGGLKMKAFMALKNALNILQLKYDRRVDAAIRQASLLVSSIPDSYKAIKKYKKRESVVIPETGCFDETIVSDYLKRFEGETLNVMWVGKFDFRKRLDIAIKTLAKTESTNIRLKVFGSGTPEQINNVKALASKLNVSGQITWMGNRPNDEIKREMARADIFLFTSVSEDTSTVVLEAISCHLPVLCFDTCGMSAVIDDKVGMKIPITNPVQSAKDFAEKIEYLYAYRDVLKTLSDNCIERQKELSWDSKAKKMVGLYEQVL